MTCALLFVAGLCRSMQFTAINTVAFANISHESMTGTNTLISAAFQFNAGLGISVGAIALRIGQASTDAGSVGVFQIAFLTIAAFALLGIVDSWRLDPTTGFQLPRGD